MSYLNKKLSVGVSLSLISASQWCGILTQYAEFIHDIYFSPVENMLFQSRRTIYDFSRSTVEQRMGALERIIDCARRCGIELKLVLNSIEIRDNFDDTIKMYQKYKDCYGIDYVTTYLGIAHKIQEYDSESKIICSFNQGIKSHKELESILDEHVFYGIVLGERFLHDFDAYKIVKEHDVQFELLVNNGCMLDCGRFCVNNVPYCRNNFQKNLSQKGIVHLYAETSLMPEELTYFYAPSKLVDIFKLSSRPTDYDEITNMLASYTSGESRTFIEKDKKYYHLYGRLTRFEPYYNDIDYRVLENVKKEMWKSIGYL